MFPSMDPSRLFDRSLLGHLETILPPPPKPDASTFFPLPPPASNPDSSSVRALADHLLGGPMPAPPPRPPQPKGQSADKNMAALAAPTGLHGINNMTVSGRRRAPRRDRHSKINTAQGLRDRRMRLSLDVARRFFDLQDMLGFDKASRTVEWLLAKSRSAIRDLTGCSLSPPTHTDAGEAKGESTSTSECEAISVSTSSKPTEGEPPRAAYEVDILPRAKKAASRPPRKAVASPALARETRLMARARARERTREKQLWCRGLHGVNGQAVQLLPVSSPLQMTGAKPGIHSMKFFPDVVAELEAAISCPLELHRTTVPVNSEAYPQAAMTRGSAQIPAFDYTGNLAHDGGSGAAGFAQEQWNMQRSGNIEDPTVLFGDVQQQAWQREAFNIPCI